jgi:hypothetical protein
MGVARQETEFHADTISTAGARGILQVMKVTANHVCRDYKIKCHHDKLLTDSSYNTMLASAYIGDRMAEFSGSYVLGIAGYNAGPGRARLDHQFGDPQANVDPLDWIEHPSTDTPVRRGLQYQIYRAQMEAEPLRLEGSRARDGVPPRGTDRAQPIRRNPTEPRRSGTGSNLGARRGPYGRRTPSSRTSISLRAAAAARRCYPPPASRMAAGAVLPD